MTLRWLIATIHLLGLGIGLGSVWARSRALLQPLDRAGLGRVFAADNWWAAAAAIWLITGLVRAFGGLEKGSAYYLNNHIFWLKLGLFVTIVALEIKPIGTLIKWRQAVRRGETPDTSAAVSMARTSVIQAVLVIAMVLAATAMARGFGARM